MAPHIHLARALAMLALLVPTASACRQPARGQADPAAQPATRQATTLPVYGFLERPSRDGIGKVYMGREISQVMGHLAAGWLERPEREAEEKPALLLDNLALEPDDVVADIGA